MGNAESAESEAVLNELKGNDVNDLIQQFNRLNESIKTNIKNAQAKQEKAYKKRKNKGYKTYKLNAGDNVLKKNLKKLGKKEKNGRTTGLGHIQLNT